MTQKQLDLLNTIVEDRNRVKDFNQSGWSDDLKTLGRAINRISDGIDKVKLDRVKTKVLFLVSEALEILKGGLEYIEEDLEAELESYVISKKIDDGEN